MFKRLDSLYFIFSYIPNVRLIITEILAYKSQFPKRIDALIVEGYMNVTKEFWVMPVRYLGQVPNFESSDWC